MSLNDFTQALSNQYDVCVVGDGASALWAVHANRREGRSVLWVTSEEPGSVARLLLKRAWCWNVDEKSAEALLSVLGLSNDEVAMEPFEAVYFDARSSKRFKKLSESRIDWGEHEEDVLPQWLQQKNTETKALDVSSAHLKVWDRYSSLLQNAETNAVTSESAVITIDEEPKLVIAKSFLILELHTENQKVTTLEIAPKGKETRIQVQASRFILGDIGEPFADIVENKESSEALRNTMKGRSFKSGYSLEFLHKDGFEIPVSQTVVIPLVANPSKKGQGSHVVGRFFKNQETGQVMSCFFGLLTEEELEDNNEILKKMRSSRRAIERTLAGFEESIAKESLTFEPQMVAQDLLKKRNHTVLEAVVVTDVFGPTAVVDTLVKSLSV